MTDSEAKSDAPVVDAAIIRQLKIKTGVVKRLAKEMQSYEKETLQQERRIETMKQDGREAYDVKKQGEILHESKMMILDCRNRLKTAAEDLQRYMECESTASESDEYKAAAAALQDTAGLVGSH